MFVYSSRQGRVENHRKVPSALFSIPMGAQWGAGSPLQYRKTIKLARKGHILVCISDLISSLSGGLKTEKTIRGEPKDRYLTVFL